MPRAHSPGQLDVQQMRELLALLEQHNVASFFYEDAKIKLRVVRAAPVAPIAAGQLTEVKG